MGSEPETNQQSTNRTYKLECGRMDLLKILIMDLK